MADLLPAVEIEPSTPAQGSVIWLHGLGADGHDFEPIATEFKTPLGVPVRFVFPHAPSMPVTVNGGMVMPAWYDILELGERDGRRFNREQLQVSVQAVHALIDREIERGIPSHKIILAGFSQGGAVNYEAGLTYPKPLGGMVALSTYFPTFDTIVVNRDSQAALQILICHGTEDTVLPVNLARDSRRALESFGFTPVLRTYRMAHEVCREELVTIIDFMKFCLEK